MLCVSTGIVDDFNLIYTLCSFKIFLKEMVWLFLIRKSKKCHKTVCFLLVVKFWRLPNSRGRKQPDPAPRRPHDHSGWFPLGPSSARGLFHGLFQMVVFRVKCGQRGFRGDWEQASSFLVQRLLPSEATTRAFLLLVVFAATLAHFIDAQ